MDAFDTTLRRRPSARLLVVDGSGALLLFRFVLPDGRDFWATPGGAVEPGEALASAASRELEEETGIVAPSVGEPVARRRFVMRLPDGEAVVADEAFFVVRVASRAVRRDGFSELERRVIREMRWWTADELRAAVQTVWPADLAVLLDRVLADA